MAANEPGQPSIRLSEEPSLNYPTPKSALAIGAHPDDVEFGCGGTLAKWAADGCVIHHLVCTDGSKGTWDASADTIALAARRQIEQRDAAARLARGIAAVTGEVRFLEYIDGELESSLRERGDVAKVIRELQPQVVLGHDPWKRYRLHPDHRHAGLLACEGIVAARDPHFYREHGTAHHRPDALLLWEADEPDHGEDISAHINAKLDALHAHESQFESTMKVADGNELDVFDERIRARVEGLGTPFGVGAAEVFKLITSL
ncbi:MAG: LmbE family N-acetylglucosaminyl deacetylase [Ilumatobacter sp.]|jgi:LmbE family N-acetylglucosaminyl deacetylase